MQALGLRRLAGELDVERGPPAVGGTRSAAAFVVGPLAAELAWFDLAALISPPSELPFAHYVVPPVLRLTKPPTSPAATAWVTRTARTPRHRGLLVVVEDAAFRHAFAP
ncbi:MAG TPA: hypothetical protein VFS43_25450 [Polyangiaceae bacterium]|nr:hypothetical protein [Polyangiaceae bacterium]